MDKDTAIKNLQEASEVVGESVRFLETVLEGDELEYMKTTHILLQEAAKAADKAVGGGFLTRGGGGKA